MGKSDPYVFSFYEKVLEDEAIKADSVAFLGFSGENLFTRTISAENRDFYDLSLKNWNINADWKLPRSYELIVCTRCPYFSREPEIFVSKCLDHVDSGGHVLLDWGLGDHWRFKNYKVGWIKDGDQEFAYKEDNFLHSCFWKDGLEKDPEVSLFWENVKKRFPEYGDKRLEEVVKSEVPKVVNYDCKSLRTLFLWPESPQLYIATLIFKN